MDDLFVRPYFDDSKVTVSFTATNADDAIAYTVIDADGKSVSGGAAATGKAGTITTFDIALSGFRPWSVDDPFLYTLKMTVGNTEVCQPFGMTKIHTHARAVYFNNQPLYIRGHIRGREAHDHPNFLNVPDRDYYEKNILASKQFGFNFMRFHSRVPDEDYLDAADRLGMLVQVEIRKYYGKYQKERAATNFDGDQTLVEEHDWEQMIYRLRNHPCVLIYCMGNEINNPGNNERVRIISKLTKQLDPTRLFLDTCSRGQFDRDTVDIDVQHMSYFAPFGKNYNMFNDTIHLSIYGSVTGKDMVTSSETAAARTRREVPVQYPLVAHEVCHYNVLRDPCMLKKKFADSGHDAPWWVDELIKMIQAKGHEHQFQTMLEASTHYQYIWIKQCLESIRRSPELIGFQMLQLSDTDRYENANGLVDCFDDIKDIPPEKIVPFNQDTVVVADLPRRSFAEGQKVTIPVVVSDYSAGLYQNGIFSWTLKDNESDNVNLTGSLDQCDLPGGTTRSLCRLEITMPAVDTPRQLELQCTLTSADGTHTATNRWDLWLFPDRPDRVPDRAAAVNVSYARLTTRYPQLAGTAQSEPRAQATRKASERRANAGHTLTSAFPGDGVGNSDGDDSTSPPCKGGDQGGAIRAARASETPKHSLECSCPADLLITDKLDDAVFDHLRNGKDVLLTYRTDENRKRHFTPGPYYLPSTWERFKGIIWDRGHNCGGFTRPHPILDDFPIGRFIDWQMYDLLEDSDKLNIDDFPAVVEPIIEGVDKATRDRFDVGRFDLSEFQYEYTMRKFAHLIELCVGKGRLIITGMNFAGVDRDEPATCWMFESILRYMASDAFRPAASIDVDTLRDYAAEKARSPRIKERMMTQYWQLDDAPLESKQYWAESEAWLRE